MDAKELFLEKLKEINVWSRGDTRAPHKPLLLLLALSKIDKGQRLMQFEDVEKRMKELLVEYGPSQRNPRPQYPFWRLKNDGIWDFMEDSMPDRLADPSPNELTTNNAKAGFKIEYYNLLEQDKELIYKAAKVILDGHFPDSLHDDILNEFSISTYERASKRIRDPKFRGEIIRAYEHRCAVCGCDLRLGASDFIIEAAHIKWVQAGGPDIIQNGLALCALHHKAFDRGALGLTKDYKIIVSAEVYGQSELAKQFISLNDRKLFAPYRPDLLPQVQYIQWHQKEVFRKPKR